MLMMMMAAASCCGCCLLLWVFLLRWVLRAASVGAGCGLIGIMCCCSGWLLYWMLAAASVQAAVALAGAGDAGCFRCCWMLWVHLAVVGQVLACVGAAGYLFGCCQTTTLGSLHLLRPVAV